MIEIKRIRLPALVVFALGLSPLPGAIQAQTTTTELAKLIASDAAPKDNFGYSVAISGDTAVVGASHDTHTGGLEAGSAYVFERSNTGGAGTWGEVVKLTASDAAAGDYFGISVAISGDTIMVGAYRDYQAGIYSGSAYVFDRNRGGTNVWGEVQKLTASDAASQDYFGRSVAISGDTAVVGASHDTHAGGAMAGSAYVFERNQGGASAWVEVAKLTASDAASDDRFGYSVAVSKDTVVVGAVDDVHAPGVGGAFWGEGSAYLFERDQGGPGAWGEVVKLTASSPTAGDSFGISVAVSGDTALVGEHLGGVAGRAHCFERNQGGAGSWGWVQELTASDQGAGEYFGISVSISGGTAVVGAHGFHLAPGASEGSAYLFERGLSGGQPWTEVAKIYASDAASGDRFGISVALSGNTIVVGASGDDQGFSVGEVKGLAFDPWTNTLYGADATNDQLVTINRVTGEGIPIGPFGLDKVRSLAFDPGTNTLYGAESPTG